MAAVTKGGAVAGPKVVSAELTMYDVTYAGPARVSVTGVAPLVKVVVMGNGMVSVS